ncbi:MAG: 16S rRNA (guanine(966)-N(2))-methyltransferase RsmD [Bacilli bacterium]|nr:16S rRNA (guanine(966)-N(2))-methyltransferase RsmD [Bacilli bacterium]
MKVISGKYKGRNIQGFDISGTRPTMDRVKESLFAMIQNSMDGAVVLDLFSGSGNLGIEALSEGASFAYFCDRNHKACSVIENNLKNMGIVASKVFCMDYKKCLDFFEKESLSIIFLDPPYKTDYIEKSLNIISEKDLLKSDGIVVCESDSLDKIVYPNSFSCVKERKYGEKNIVILQKI